MLDTRQARCALIASLILLSIAPQYSVARTSRIVLVPGGVSSLLLAPSGGVAYAANGGALYTIDLRARRLTSVLPLALALPSDIDPATGLMTVVGSTVDLFDPGNGNRRTLAGFSSFAAFFAGGRVWIPTYSCVFAPSYTCQDALSVFSLEGQHVDAVELGQSSQQYCGARSPNGSIIVLGDLYPPQLRAISTVDARDLGVVPTGVAPCPVAVADDGRAVVANLSYLYGFPSPSSTAVLQLVDINEPHAPPRVIQIPHATVSGVAIDARHERAFVSIAVVHHVDDFGTPRDYHRRLVVLSLRHWTIERTLTLSRRLGGLGTVVTDGTRVVVGGQKGVLVLSKL